MKANFKTIELFPDGDQICAVFEGAVNLQESPAGFGKNKYEAVENLLDNVGIFIQSCTRDMAKELAENNCISVNQR